MTSTKQEIVVGARDRKDVAFTLTSCGVLSYTLEVGKNLDVGLEVQFTAAADGASSVLQPKLRLGPREEYSLTVLHPGEVTFRFDNTYSLLKSKAVTLTTRVLSEEEGRAEHKFSPCASLRVVEDSHLLNRFAMTGIEHFFTNKFALAEAEFALERLRVRVSVVCAAARGNEVAPVCRARCA